MNELEKRAKFHKKRLKGLPRTSLNTNAGNVEHNVAMFNHINSPAEGPSNNPISGPFGGDVGAGMGEAIENKIIPLYVIKDNHGNILSAPNTNEAELWDRVNAMEARDRRGLCVVAYTPDMATRNKLKENINWNSIQSYLRDRLQDFYIPEYFSDEDKPDINLVIKDIEKEINSNYPEMVHYISYWANADKAKAEGVPEDIYNIIASENFPEGLIYNHISNLPGFNEDHNIAEALRNDKEYIELEYPDLEFEQHGHIHWDGDYDSWDRVADWTIKVEKEDIETFLYENCIDDTDVSNWYDMTREESEQWVKDNFDDLFEKYKELILENWIEDAIDDATANYDPDDYVDWDMMPGGHDDIDVDESIESENKKSSYEGLDDKFDMSLRTF